MAGQAGWYRAPGEEGLLRYWDGTTWTSHRQPASAATPGTQVEPATATVAPTPVIAQAVVEPTPTIEPTAAIDIDPMAEYERQFASNSAPAVESALAPAAQPAFAAAGASSFFSSPPPLPALAEQPELPPVAEPSYHPQIADATADQPEGFLQHVLSSVENEAENPHAQGIGEELGGAALAADGLIGFGPNRKGIFGALKGIGTGLLIVVIGIAIMAFMSANNTAGAGEVRGSGIVTSLGSTSGNSCTPVARFAVGRKSYSASSTLGISPCPVTLGQTVDVIYSTANPASNARVEMGTSVTQFLWLIPVLGGVVFLSSLFTFIVRAGSIAGGIALVRDGNRRRREPAEAS
jgi:hypothetical protein